MPLTKVQLISNALTLIGSSPITSLENGGNIVTAAIQAYDFLLPAKLCENSWRFACTIQQLAQLVEKPVVQQWQYIYQLPANFLKTIHMYPQNYDFEFYENGKIYSNLKGPLFLEYVFMPVQQNIPDYFNNYFVYELAAYLALANAQNVNYATYLEGKREIQRAIAMSIDSQNRPQTPLFSQPVINRRYVAAAIYG